MLAFTHVSIGDGLSRSGSGCEPARAHAWRPSSEVASDIAAAVRGWNAGSGPNISLGGAEPLDYHGLPSVLRFAHMEGVKRVRLETDCAALRAPDEVRSLLNAGVRHILFTLLGSDAHRHDKLAGRAGAFDASVAGLRLFREVAQAEGVGVHLSAHVPVCRATLQDLPAIVAKAASNGLGSAHLAVVDPTLDLRTAAAWVEAACDTGIVDEIWVDVEGIPFGFAEGWELHLACVYRPVEGAKSARCRECALDAVCGGAAVGTTERVLATLREPLGAEITAEMVARSFRVPGSDHVHA